MTCAERPHLNSTVSRLLDGAERNLLSHGYKGASIRRITEEAGANVAAINYHFGSKRALFAELFQRRFQPVALRRAELLQAIEASASNSIEDIVLAYFGTLFRYRESAGEQVAAVIWMLLNGDPEASQLASECMGDGYTALLRRYAQALARAIPDVPMKELKWRLEMMERFALCVIAGPRAGWTAKAIDFSDAGATRTHGSLGDGLVAIIQACIQAPRTVPLESPGRI